MNGVSVILCCFNSTAILSKTLKYIVDQKVSKSINWEVLIVDNNSTDKTAHLADTELRRMECPVDFRVISESEPGLSYARETGIRNAKYDYIIFCDDDNFLEEDYVREAYSIMESDPEIGALGGWSKAASNVPIPEWFHEVSAHYAIGPQGDEGDITLSRMYLWGAGIVIRKSAWNEIQKAGFKSLLTGRSGEKLTSGDDSEICLAMILAGYSLWYSPKLRFTHFMQEKRLDRTYYESMLQGHIDSDKVLSVYRKIVFQAIENKTIWSRPFFWCLYRYMVVTFSGISSDSVVNFSTLKEELQSYLKWHMKVIDMEYQIWKLNKGVRFEVETG